MKRSLQDDQNAALERVRGTEGAAVAERLGSEREQRDRYALASVEPLRDAANAGRSFAASEGGVVGPELADAGLAELAEDLAATLVTALRKRMSNDNGKDGTDRVTSAYRDWRGARTERLCADLSLRAFHAGVAAASSGSAGSVRRRARRAPLRAVHRRGRVLPARRGTRRPFDSHRCTRAAAARCCPRDELSVRVSVVGSRRCEARRT